MKRGDKNNSALFYLMQFSGGTFPSGGFSQSWGLETYVTKGLVRDETSFTEFVEVYLASTVAGCEGPIMCEAYRLGTELDTDFGDEVSLTRITELEDLSRAIKLTGESKESSLRMGKAFLRILADAADGQWLGPIKTEYIAEGMSYPVIYGLVCGRLDLGLEESLRAFAYSTVNALIQSGVKLIPLGNTQAQDILIRLYPAMDEAVAKAMVTAVEDITNFCPGMDIAGILHENLAVRLYMS